MAHLLDRADLDEDEIAELFAYLRGAPGGDGRTASARRRGDACVACGGYILHDVEAGAYVCDACGLVQGGPVYMVTFEDRERLDGLDENLEPTRDSYKPIHHWHERLAQYHLQETRIANADWASILARLIELKPECLSKESIRRLLRSLALQRYNENWLQIINRVTGYRPPQLLSSELCMLDACFEAVAVPFSIFKPQGRKNLINYNFLFYRLLQAVGRAECLPHFPQLKTRAKWLQLDDVWRQICAYHEWLYRPMADNQAWLELKTSDAVWRRCGEQMATMSLAAPIPKAPSIRMRRDERLVLRDLKRKSDLESRRGDWDRERAALKRKIRPVR